MVVSKMKNYVAYKNQNSPDSGSGIKHCGWVGRVGLWASLWGIVSGRERVHRRSCR
jgi:hypothetical protein